MELYDSLAGEIRPLDPPGDMVTIYVCGVTPYDTTHLGHAFTYVVFDALIRYLESTGRRVRYVQNVTDIDDDILRRAAQEGVGWRELGERETARFLADMAALNVRPPDVYPRATQEIPHMLEMATTLLERGFAYEREGNVYYRVHADPEFGKLSKLDYDAMLATANERGNVPDDPHKDDPLDFVLWQAAQPGEPTWESPWGPGRPGWHIECSAMALHYLGPTIDIHGGGHDLLFPHHECEIAQSENFTGQSPFVRFWMHVAMVRMDGDKMSKSLGNMVFVRDLLEEVPADAIRAYLLSNHYRDPWEWEEVILDASWARVDGWREALRPGDERKPQIHPGRYERAFHAAMRNDLDTPAALEVLDGLARAIIEGRERGRRTGDARRSLLALARAIGFTLDG